MNKIINHIYTFVFLKRFLYLTCKDTKITKNFLFIHKGNKVLQFKLHAENIPVFGQCIVNLLRCRKHKAALVNGKIFTLIKMSASICMKTDCNV